MKRWLITLSLVILAFVAGFQLASNFIGVSSNRAARPSARLLPVGS